MLSLEQLVTSMLTLTTNSPYTFDTWLLKQYNSAACLLQVVGFYEYNLRAACSKVSSTLKMLESLPTRKQICSQAVYKLCSPFLFQVVVIRLKQGVNNS